MMNWIVFVRKLSWPIRGLEGLSKTTKNLIQDNRYSRRDMNKHLPNMILSVTALPIRSVTLYTNVYKIYIYMYMQYIRFTATDTWFSAQMSLTPTRPPFRFQI